MTGANSRQVVRTRPKNSGGKRRHHHPTHYMPIHTEREISANRPGIVIKNNGDKKCILVDVAILSDKNTSPRFVLKMKTKILNSSESYEVR